MDFMDSNSTRCIVVIRSIDYNVIQSFSNTWRGDTSLFGSNNSLYHKLLKVGLLAIDSLNSEKSWLMIYKKDDPSFDSKYQFELPVSTDGISAEGTSFDDPRNEIPSMLCRTEYW